MSSGSQQALPQGQTSKSVFQKESLTLAYLQHRT